MKFPWIKTKAATLEELREQLAGAREAMKSAQAATKAAAAAFDEDPAREKPLLAAQDAERIAAAHVARAERMLAEAEAREQQKERARLEQRRLEVIAALRHEEAEKRLRPARDAEVRALIEAIEARFARRAPQRELEQLESELAQLDNALGEPSPHRAGSYDSEPSRHNLRDALLEYSNKLDADDPRRRYVLAMLRYVDALT